MTRTLIREGERSEQVTDVQARLRAHGIEVADEPGYFGPGTKKAVQEFQQERGILVDGIVGPHTWDELVEAGWRLGDRHLYLANPLMRGDDVLALQARLNALGYDAGREDGIYGSDTARAVSAFQGEYGIQEDGIYGPRSHLALVGLRVQRPETAATLREELWRSERTGFRDALIVIDPGHGGDDPGAAAPSDRSEADLCWDLAARVAARLAGAGARVRFTRTEAEGPDASERARRANEMNAELFVSLHLNSDDGIVAQGASTFYFPRSRSGELLAEKIQQNLVDLGLSNCRSHGRSYPLLKETRMPAVVVEPGFITNPDDAKRLVATDFRNAVADAIADAVRRYYENTG